MSIRSRSYSKPQKIVYTIRCLMKDLSFTREPSVFVEPITFYYDEKAVRHSLQKPRDALIFEDPSGTTMMGEYMCRIMGAKHVHYGNMLLNTLVVFVDDFHEDVLTDKYNACTWANTEKKNQRHRVGSKAVLSRRKLSQGQQLPTW
jgi:hypothetical protein